MFARRVKTGLLYVLILAGGLAVGYAAPRLVKAMTPAYSQGDFSAYYREAKTNVIVYGTATCPYCAKTRAYLRENKIPFADVDVNDSEKGRNDFAKLGGKGVPVILVGDRRLDGFKKGDLGAALAKAGYSVSQ